MAVVAVAVVADVVVVVFLWAVVAAMETRGASVIVLGVALSTQ